jgi:UDP-glucuronate 4-epimerase
MNRPSERIVITGGAGFIGSHLAELLLTRGDNVYVLDNFDPFYDPSEKRRNLEVAGRFATFKLIEADCSDFAAVELGLGDVEPDVIVHLAAKAGVRPSIEDPLGYARANLTGTQCMLELARRRGVKRFIFGSSSSVYGNNPTVPFHEDQLVDGPISPYAATKRANELMCHTYNHLFGIAIVALRFFTVYGPRQRPDLAIRKFGTLMLQRQAIPMFGDGSTERDYTWIDDILQGVVAAIDRTASHPGEFEIINLGESRTTTLRRLIQLIGEALQIEPRIEQRPLQPGDVQRTFADISKARALLGYNPNVPVETGIPRFADWLRTQPGLDLKGTQ